MIKRSLFGMQDSLEGMREVSHFTLIVRFKKNQGKRELNLEI